MFFLASKTLGILASPHYLALMLVGLALLLRVLRRAPRLRKALVIATVVELWVLATGVVSNLLLYPLETRYDKPARVAPPAAIVMLTGVTDDGRMEPSFDFTERADRFIETVRLAHLYPKALVVISGGSSEIVNTSFREAEALAGLARQMGVAARRLLVDREARNTRENAVFSDRLLRQAGVTAPVLLVTSAMHMPRSVDCFEKVGRKVIPWPVDYQRTDWWGSAWLPKPSSLRNSDAALHEYLGWLSYKLAGYI